ncbi:MAG: class A beta-lactamase-related serine hydrolase [Ignavibacteria bacterium]|jgi:beta-lactamase class A|nr:class A beta-lactamase-related serine hydrolase [Ignavibacteria bacterium]MDH7527197.1 class A beta-lactamase-related serine hydrolase [Ignavibacteria bacterium]
MKALPLIILLITFNLSQSAQQVLSNLENQKIPYFSSVFDTLRSELEAEINKLIQEFGYLAGIAFKDLKSNEIFTYNETEIFPTASAIKIEILIHLMKEYQDGKIDIYKNVPVNLKVGGSGILQFFDQSNLNLSYYNLAVLMIQQSDNTATNILIEKLGMENINKTIKSLGLNQTKLQRVMMDFEARKSGRENISSPKDKLTLLEMIYRGEIFPDSINNEVIKILSIPKPTPLLSEIDADITLASKGGELDDVRCEMGIFFCEKFDYILVVMTKDLPSSILGDEFIKKISRVFYNYLKLRYQ